VREVRFRTKAWALDLGECIFLTFTFGWALDLGKCLFPISLLGGDGLWIWVNAFFSLSLLSVISTLDISPHFVFLPFPSCLVLLNEEQMKTLVLWTNRLV
jgi:hypothetical protein